MVDNTNDFYTKYHVLLSSYHKSSKENSVKISELAATQKTTNEMVIELQNPSLDTYSNEIER